jgi:Leucine-rich repeat (LRR) protein
MHALLYNRCHVASCAAGSASDADNNQPARTSASGDPQLEALLKVKAALDTKHILRDWSRGSGSGARGSYCKWKGVECNDGSSLVHQISMCSESGVQGLHGTLPPAAAFAGLDYLTDVVISDQPGITGTLPADWSRLTKLQDIQLNINSLTGSIPPSWGSLSKLKALSMYTNKLSGRIPDNIGALTSLESLDLDENLLTGTIPDLGKLHNLKELQLFTNKLAGHIPDSLKTLKALTTLDLAENALDGTLPAWLGGLDNLHVLSLNDNMIKGSIPASLGNLSKLKTLRLGGNQLSGTLPNALKALPDL